MSFLGEGIKGHFDPLVYTPVMAKIVYYGHSQYLRIVIFIINTKKKYQKTHWKASRTGTWTGESQQRWFQEG